VSAPHFVGDLDDHPELRPLLVLGKRIALLAGGEAALRAQAELVEIDELGGLIDAPLDRILGFELSGSWS
jgi:hypothetical protein